MVTWFYMALTWTLQVLVLMTCYYVMRKRARQLRKVACDLFEAYELLLKARDVLRDYGDNFDARWTADQVRDHLLEKWSDLGITEEVFRRMIKDVQSKGAPRGH